LRIAKLVGGKLSTSAENADRAQDIVTTIANAAAVHRSFRVIVMPLPMGLWSGTLVRVRRLSSINCLCGDPRTQPMLDTIFAANPDIKRVQSRCARALFRAGISANVATILAALAGIASGVAFATAHAMFAIVALALSAILDALDGTIARECAAPSSLGGVLDLSADRIVEACVIVGIAWRDPALYFPALILVATWYVNITIFLAVGAALEGPSAKLIEYPPGILERTEAIVFFVVLGLVEATPILRSVGPLLCYAMAALEIITGAQRLLFGMRMLRPE
jgi:archaetidylinositol phosphate synthase